MAERRPDYVPRLWSQGPFTRWFQRSPRRVLAWLVTAAAAAIVLTVQFLSDAPHDALAYATAGLAAVLGVQAAVYGPRAWRGIRGRRPSTAWPFRDPPGD
jgi:hypothetical protein